MPESGKKPTGGNQRDEKKKKKRWLLIPLLLVFVSISSFLAGTHVGKSTDQHLGQMLDTIILSPEKRKADVNRIDFSGQVLYTDGTPCANQEIELHSDPMRTVTDSEGFFYFKSVEIGDHHLTVIGENDNPVSGISVHISRDKSIQAGLVDENAGICYLSVAEKVIQVHVKIRLDEEDRISVDQEVYTKDESGICKDAKGREVSPAMLEKAEALENREAETELPVSGENLTASENETMASGTGSAESSGNYQTPLTAGHESTADRETNLETVKDSTEIIRETSAGTETLPSESTQIPDTSSVLPTTADTSGSGGHGNSGGGHGSGDHGNSGGGSGTNPTKPDPTGSSPEPTVPDPTGPTIPDEPLQVSVKEKDGPVWTQQTAISLFADRTGAGEDRKLMPGSRGSYEFQVGNYNSYGITYTMQITAPDGQLLIPLRYRLKSDGGYLCGDGKNWLDAARLSAEPVMLSAGEEKEYLLEWQWMFEGGDDELDTKIGSGTNLEYEVIITIYIEQVVS